MQAYPLHMLYQASGTRKYRINYEATFRQLHRLLRDPASLSATVGVRPVPAASAKLRLPQLRGNVWNTMKEIVALFYAAWKRARGPIGLAVTTTRQGLAKRCGNKDPKTAYRHILTLIEQGFLRGKVHVQRGLQLLLNPALIVFDEQSLPPTVPAGPVVAPGSVLAALQRLAAQFSTRATGAS